MGSALHGNFTPIRIMVALELRLLLAWPSQSPSPLQKPAYGAGSGPAANLAFYDSQDGRSDADKISSSDMTAFLKLRSKEGRARVRTSVIAFALQSVLPAARRRPLQSRMSHGSLPTDAPPAAFRSNIGLAPLS